MPGVSKVCTTCGAEIPDDAPEAACAACVLETYNSNVERCWIGEIDAERVGSVFLTKASANDAELHLLLVEPEARGHGVGTELVTSCIRFARKAEYQKISLQTNSILQAARRIYDKAGFKLVEAKRHRHYGRGLIGEKWELKL
jgi:GNAT superfamily N-acetyltransferase